MTKIIALSGKKQSGKSTTMNFLYGIQMTVHGIIEGFKVDDDGKLIVPYAHEHGIEWGKFDITTQDPKTLYWMQENVDPFVKRFSMAAPLKNMCMYIFGLTYEQCYGTDEQKNSPTKYYWEDMPGVFDPNFLIESLQMVRNSTMEVDKDDLELFADEINISLHKTGRMTAREFLQYMGTDFGRHIENNLWADACIREIKNSGCELAIIDDLRFPNEVEVVHDADGCVIRLNRIGTSDNDQHASETALDDWDEFDFTLNNNNMTINEQNRAVFEFLTHNKLIDVPFEIQEKIKI